MRKTKRKPRVYRSLAWRLYVFVFTLWFACMGILTWCVTVDIQRQIKENLASFVNGCNCFECADASTIPGSLELDMVNHLGAPYWPGNTITPLLPILDNPFLSAHYSSKHITWDEWIWHNDYEAAVIYYNENDEILIKTGDYLTFSYTTESKWAELEPVETGLGYIALDEVPGGDELADGHISLVAMMSLETYYLPLLRLTGYFEGNQFHPAKIDGIRAIEWEIDLVFQANVDAQNRLEWENLLTVDVEEDIQLETIYAWNVRGYNCLRQEVSLNGKSFASLSDLLHQNMINGHPFPYQKESLLESVYIDYQEHHNDNGAFTIAVAIRCKPLQSAFSRLIIFYCLSFLITILCTWLIQRRMKKHIFWPVKSILNSVGKGTAVTPNARYAEIYDLENHFFETHQSLSKSKAEIQRLRTALDYAHDAEEKRKQLISDITHELKTPLAVIHSYAECLQEDIPEEKQEQYLQTIMEQTERMDAMVVQMLDLSRLEAGKVRLSSDQFSLLGLTKSVAEKMDLLFNARGLTVLYHWPQDFTITADEARMEQVIANLLSNAQKYTTEGGTVRIKTRLSNGNVHFYIENTAEHLSKEALEKVWDSFYRVDASRNTAGTGLGLSIVKSIISLHGGSCVVRNTWINDEIRAVEFGFILPLK